MINVHLEKLTWDTVDDVLKLKVSKEQKEFVATNRDSMIDAYFALTEEKFPVYTFGIYLEKKPVGFLMIGYDVPWAEQYYNLPRGYYYIWRFMIDKRYQGNGYGREALKLAVDFVKTSPSGKAEYCWLSYEPENEVARKLYLSFGFEEKKELWKEDQEIPAVYKLWNPILRDNTIHLKSPLKTVNGIFLTTRVVTSAWICAFYSRYCPKACWVNHVTSSQGY